MESMSTQHVPHQYACVKNECSWNFLSDVDFQRTKKYFYFDARFENEKSNIVYYSECLKNNTFAAKVVHQSREWQRYKTGFYGNLTYGKSSNSSVIAIKTSNALIHVGPVIKHFVFSILVYYLSRGGILFWCSLHASCPFLSWKITSKCDEFSWVRSRAYIGGKKYSEIRIKHRVMNSGVHPDMTREVVKKFKTPREI